MPTNIQNNRFVVPYKNTGGDPVKEQTNWEALELWANSQVVNRLVAGSHVTLSAQTQTLTTNGKVPPFTGIVTVNASGGGSGGITDITSNDASIFVSNPTGPTVDLSVNERSLSFNATDSSSAGGTILGTTNTLIHNQAVQVSGNPSDTTYFNFLFAGVRIFNNISATTTNVEALIIKHSDSSILCRTGSVLLDVAGNPNDDVVLSMSVFAGGIAPSDSFDFVATTTSAGSGSTNRCFAERNHFSAIGIQLS